MTKERLAAVGGLTSGVSYNGSNMSAPGANVASQLASAANAWGSIASGAKADRLEAEKKQQDAVDREALDRQLNPDKYIARDAARQKAAAVMAAKGSKLDIQPGVDRSQSMQGSAWVTPKSNGYDKIGANGETYQQMMQRLTAGQGQVGPNEQPVPVPKDAGVQMQSVADPIHQVNSTEALASLGGGRVVPVSMRDKAQAAAMDQVMQARKGPALTGTTQADMQQVAGLGANANQQAAAAGTALAKFEQDNPPMSKQDWGQYNAMEGQIQKLYDRPVSLAEIKAEHAKLQQDPSQEAAMRDYQLQGLIRGLEQGGYEQMDYRANQAEADRAKLRAQVDQANGTAMAYTQAGADLQGMQGADQAAVLGQMGRQEAAQKALDAANGMRTMQDVQQEKNRLQGLLNDQQTYSQVPVKAEGSAKAVAEQTNRGIAERNAVKDAARARAEKVRAQFAGAPKATNDKMVAVVNAEAEVQEARTAEARKEAEAKRDKLVKQAEDAVYKGENKMPDGVSTKMLLQIQAIKDKRKADKQREADRKEAKALDQKRYDKSQERLDKREAVAKEERDRKQKERDDENEYYSQKNGEVAVNTKLRDKVDSISTMTREQFDKLSPAEQKAEVARVNKAFGIDGKNSEAHAKKMQEMGAMYNKTRSASAEERALNAVAANPNNKFAQKEVEKMGVGKQMAKAKALQDDKKMLAELLKAQHKGSKGTAGSGSKGSTKQATVEQIKSVLGLPGKAELKGNKLEFANAVAAAGLTQQEMVMLKQGTYTKGRAGIAGMFKKDGTFDKSLLNTALAKIRESRAGTGSESAGGPALDEDIAMLKQRIKAASTRSNSGQVNADSVFAGLRGKSKPVRSTSSKTTKVAKAKAVAETKVNTAADEAKKLAEASTPGGYAGYDGSTQEDVKDTIKNIVADKEEAKKAKKFSKMSNIKAALGSKQKPMYDDNVERATQAAVKAWDVKHPDVVGVDKQMAHAKIVNQYRDEAVKAGLVRDDSKEAGVFDTLTTPQGYKQQKYIAGDLAELGSTVGMSEVAIGKLVAKYGISAITKITKPLIGKINHLPSIAKVRAYANKFARELNKSKMTVAEKEKAMKEVQDAINVAKRRFGNTKAASKVKKTPKAKNTTYKFDFE